MPERMEFDLTFGPARKRREEGEPLRMLLVGDFSHRPVSERPALASRPTQSVDVDTLDAVMRRTAPRLHDASGDMTFADIDDFHPDRLFKRLDRFRSLRDAHANPAAANADVLFGQLLGKPPRAGGAGGQRPGVPATGLDALIQKIVAPHVVQDNSAETNAMLAAINGALAQEMRGLLHDPQFQALESAWRGVYFLVSRLEIDEHLQLHLFDVTREELADDLLGGERRLDDTALHRALVDRWRNVPGAHAWSVVATLFDFGPSEPDVALLTALGLLAARAGGPLLGGARDALTESESSSLQHWASLRRSDIAPAIALAWPRILLRSPYGQRSDPIEYFAFDEFDGEPDAQGLLWGAPALALLLLMGSSFTQRGWDMEPGDEREIDDMPAYSYKVDGEAQLLPSGEHVLTERRIAQLLDGGIVPIASRRDRSTAVVVAVQSIAQPAAPLAW